MVDAFTLIPHYSEREKSLSEGVCLLSPRWLHREPEGVSSAGTALELAERTSAHVRAWFVA